MSVFPRRNPGHTPSAKSSKVVREIPGEHGILFVEAIRPDRVGIIPAVPEIACAELLRLPAQIRFFRFADLEGAVAKKLRVPFRQAKLPRHFGAAEFALALEPSAVHRPVPRERRAVFASEHGLHTRVCPVPEPV